MSQDHNVRNAEALGKVFDAENDLYRFELELEFIQCLANPRYLGWLKQEKYLDDPQFLNYLNYLSYWSNPEYAKFVEYPHSLYFLKQLNKKEFRDALVDERYVEAIRTQQYNHWLYHQNNRINLTFDKLDQFGVGPGIPQEL